MLFKEFIYILFVYYVFAEHEDNLKTNDGHVFLTDMSTIHYKIPYLITDQCMTRPEQKEHGSYGLIFERHFSHLCDELLICYPSQLSGNNTRNGIIPSIPYRLREGKKNNVTIKCEQKRKEFCKEAKNENLCSTGKPASTIWHGILITTEQLITFKHSDSDYDYDFLTTISLSITKQRYELIGIEIINLEFGRKEGIITKVHLQNNEKGIFLGNDADLYNEFTSKVEQGAYLHKYAGLWALGLDLLPTSAQSFLHLFVYRGCVCSINAWFKAPTTPKVLIPAIPKRLGRNKKNCSTRYTNNALHILGPVSDGDKMVKFSLWMNNLGRNGKIEFTDSTGIFLKIEFVGKEIIFHNMVGFMLFPI
uniref:Uncharacterized protein n=1 Tax=Meloidogyne enterolobii TaxID=390850 RepID=A0A6V7WKR1_MELEN|nr:unnamed protein product [Meloidogyne enterolobii]